MDAQRCSFEPSWENIIKLEYHHQPLGYFWCFAMGFNEDIIKALTSLLNEEIINSPYC